MITYESGPKKGETVVDAGFFDVGNLLAFAGYCLKSSSLTGTLLERAAASTVLISTAWSEPHGSGVIVCDEGKKYVITATHVLLEKAMGLPTSLIPEKWVHTP